MIHHISIAASNAHHVATVLAEILHGYAIPFPPNPNSYVAIAGDEYGTIIEVYPSGSEILPGRTADEQAIFEQHSTSRPYSAFHAAISVPASLEEIQAIGDREGWRVLSCSRDGLFNVIEFWIENQLMIELLTPAFAATYLTAMSPENLARFASELSLSPAHV